MHPIAEAAAFQPYGFLLAGRSRRSSVATSRSSPNESCVATPKQGPMESPHCVVDMATEHGRHLSGHLEFIVPPHINPVDASYEQPASSYCLFLGHLKFETTPADVRWLVKKLTGVTALKAEFRGSGCCVVYLASEADETAVRGLNRRVLFDHGGVWFAHTPAAEALLTEYVEKILPRLGSRRRCLRLPRDSLVVEESRSAKKMRRPPQLSPKEARAFTASSPPTPYSLGSPLTLGGFHVAPPEYALPSESTPCSLSTSSLPPPPPYSY